LIGHRWVVAFFVVIDDERDVGLIAGAVGAVGRGEGFGFGIACAEDGGGIGGDDEIANAIGWEVEEAGGFGAREDAFDAGEFFDDGGDARFVGEMV